MNFKEWLILTEKIMIKDQEFREPLLALQYIRKTHPNPENLAVTFTRIDKVGLNPESKYDTPLGIYLYPIDYVIEKQMNVPFAGNEPNINVCEFTRPEKILHMTSDISNQKGMELLSAFPKEDVDKAIQYIAGYYYITSNYSKLWIVTRMLANNKPTQWNTNLRKCGIDGFMDHGTGTIHPNEPTQCVVFAANNLKLLHSINNPAFEKITDKFGHDTYERKTVNYNSNKMSDEQIIGLLQSRRILDVKNLLDSATDKDKIAKIIIEKQPELSDDNVRYLLLNVNEPDKIVKILGKDKLETFNYLSVGDAHNFISSSSNKEKMIDTIFKYKKNLDIDQIYNMLLGIFEPDKIAEIIIKRKELLHSKLSSNQFFELLINKAVDKEKVAKILGDDINEISDEHVEKLISNSQFHRQLAGKDEKNSIDQMSEIIIKYKTKLSNFNVSNLFMGNNKQKIASLLKNQIHRINDISSTSIAKLLAYSNDKNEMVEELGANNISKISGEHIGILLDLATDKPKMAQIINKYHTKKTPEIQELIDKYLQPQTIAAK